MSGTDNNVSEITVIGTPTEPYDDQASPTTPKLNASLLRLKLLDSLRNNDQVKLRQYVEQARTGANSEDEQIENVLRLLLHYAVQVAPLPMLQFIVANGFVEDVNIQDSDGNTPLHLAVNSSRYDIVNYLMNLPSINDCICNFQGKQALELTDDLAIIQLMSDLRTNFVETSSNELRRLFETRNYPQLSTLLSNQRVVELLDINGTDPVTGDGVLHEFVRKDDVAMCKFILEHGGDPFKRNTSGKLPLDLLSSSQMKKLLKDSSKEQSIIDPMGNGSNLADQPPTFKGFLKKWTNFAGGYKLRWFVLDADGRLSYYKSPNDMNKSCRGAINLSNARLKMDSSEKSKFEIEIPSTSGTPIKWHLKSNHYIELNRWVWFLQNAIRYNKDLQKAQLQHQKQRSTSSRQTQRVRDSFDSARTNNTYNLNQNPQTHQRAGSGVSLMSASSFSDTDSDIDVVKKSSKVKRLRKKLTPGSSSNNNSNGNNVNDAQNSLTVPNSSASASILPLEEINENSRLKVERRRTGQSCGSSVVSRANSLLSNSPSSMPPSAVDPVLGGDDSEAEDDEDVQEIDQTTGDVIEKKSGPYGSKIIVLQNNLKIEISSLKEFLSSSNASSAEEVLGICNTTLTQVEKLLSELKTVLNARDAKINRRINRQKEISTLWENSIKSLEFEMREREKKIVELEDKQIHLKKVLKQKFSSGAGTPNLGQTAAEADTKNGYIDPEDAEIVKFIEEVEDESEDEFFDAEGSEEQFGSVSQAKSEPSSAEKDQTNVADDESEFTLTNESEKRVKQDQQDQPDQVDHQDHPVNPLQKVKQELIEVKEGSFKGYEDPIRTRLAMKDDDRPKLSLWSILKSMVGKDMTKITLPVSFNEPTSLLQRVAEDMEYTDLLTRLANEENSAMRMVYVAAFAASEYASTINRIAKPFNPLLGETFEYSRPDKEYRFVVEQVSHHPPIGAAMAESKYWDYYGESLVESKFYGRSFDIKPLGTWFLNMRPTHGSVNAKSGVVTKEELYTWKKVTSSVVGIIVGNPKVDNYGDMHITNHNTGDSIVLQFKARGWRESSAYEVKGTVLDLKKRPQYQVFGHWNSKIFVRPASSANDKKPAERTLVWLANPRPKIPFNLTEFATSLNAPQEHLMEWLPRTDTRLRPDQRAMEDGRYDDAATGKNRVEEKQRAAKKRRDARKEVYQPTWFSKGTHPVTGEPYWKFTGDYWRKRYDKNFGDIPDIF